MDSFTGVVAQNDYVKKASDNQTESKNKENKKLLHMEEL